MIRLTIPGMKLPSREQVNEDILTHAAWLILYGFNIKELDTDARRSLVEDIKNHIVAEYSNSKDWIEAIASAFIMLSSTKKIARTQFTISKDPYTVEGYARPNRVREVIAGLHKAGVDTSTVGNWRYLDFGCNNGFNTINVAAELGLKKKNTHGVDIGRDPIHPNYHNYMIYKQVPIDSPKTGLRANSYDLITAYMVLHHVSDFRESIKELSRLIKSGGYLFIREHDCHGPRDKTDTQCRVYLNVAHIATEMRCSNLFPSPDHNNSYKRGSPEYNNMVNLLRSCNYFPFSALDREMRNNGFKRMYRIKYSYQWAYDALYRKE